MATTASTKERTRKTTSAPAVAMAEKPMTVDRTARIAARAFQLFEQRGWQHGNDLADWLQAERELYGSAR